MLSFLPALRELQCKFDDLKVLYKHLSDIVMILGRGLFTVASYDSTQRGAAGGHRAPLQSARDPRYHQTAN